MRCVLVFIRARHPIRNHIILLQHPTTAKHTLKLPTPTTTAPTPTTAPTITAPTPTTGIPNPKTTAPTPTTAPTTTAPTPTTEFPSPNITDAAGTAGTGRQETTYRDKVLDMCKAAEGSSQEKRNLTLIERNSH